MHIFFFFFFVQLCYLKRLSAMEAVRCGRPSFRSRLLVCLWSSHGKKKKTRMRDLIRRVDVQHSAGCATSTSARQLGYSTVFPRATGFHPSAAALFKHPVTACATQPTLTHSHTHSRVWFPQGANTIMKITSQQSSIKLTASPFPFSPPSRQETIKARHIAASSGFLSLQQNYSPRLWSHCWRVT